VVFGERLPIDCTFDGISTYYSTLIFLDLIYIPFPFISNINKNKLKQNFIQKIYSIIKDNDYSSGTSISLDLIFSITSCG